jgi:nitroreductase
MPATLEDLGELIRARRTHMIVDRQRPVPSTLVEELCELAMWAPNHKRTWPWRFVHLTGDSRCGLGESFVIDMRAAGIGDEARWAKTLTKYARTPSLLAVAAAAHDEPRLHAENRDAVAAGVQNVLLGATAAGLASFWSTPPIEDCPSALTWCGFDPVDRFVALVYLGWPVSAVPAPPRPPLSIRHLD